MQVSLICRDRQAGGQDLADQLAFFEERGDDVALFVEAVTQDGAPTAAPIYQVTLADLLEQRPVHFAGSDLVVYHDTGGCSLLASLPRLERGATIFYEQDATGSTPGVHQLASFADLVVAASPPIARLLIDQHGCAEAQVRVIAAHTTPAEYAIGWRMLVAEATQWLPNRPYPYGYLPAMREANLKRAPGAVPPPAAKPSNATLSAKLQQLQTSADTKVRDYVVRSGLPVIGRLVVWLRRNLTSHLREPYVDPTFRRQENFNHLVADVLAQLADQQVAASSESTLEARLAELEAQVATLAEAMRQLAAQAHKEDRPTP